VWIAAFDLRGPRAYAFADFKARNCEGMIDIGRTLKTAADCYNNGDAASSERLCRQVLAIGPNNAPALHLQGLIVATQGRAAEALDLIGRSLKINPANSMAWVHHAIALDELGEFEQSLSSYDKASIADPSTRMPGLTEGSACTDWGDFPKQ
jgi:Flp pilus assembly protein TadD